MTIRRAQVYPNNVPPQQPESSLIKISGYTASQTTKNGPGKQRGPLIDRAILSSLHDSIILCLRLHGFQGEGNNVSQLLTGLSFARMDTQTTQQI